MASTSLATETSTCACRVASTPGGVSRPDCNRLRREQKRLYRPISYNQIVILIAAGPDSRRDKARDLLPQTANDGGRRRRFRPPDRLGDDQRAGDRGRHDPARDEMTLLDIAIDAAKGQNGRGIGAPH